MGRFVFLLLLVSCFATGLGLECYECVSDVTLLAYGIGTLPYISAACSSDSFKPDRLKTLTVTGPSGTVLPAIKPAYCVKMVVSFKGLVGVTIRTGFSSPASSFSSRAGSFNSTKLSGLDTDDFLNTRLTQNLPRNIQTLLLDPNAAIRHLETKICDSNLCNSVSGLRQSNAALAMSVVVLMTTMANTFN